MLRTEVWAEQRPAGARVSRPRSTGGTTAAGAGFWAPAVCGGRQVILGTRVQDRTILSHLSDGSRAEEILGELPSLQEVNVRVVEERAAASAGEDLPVQFPVPTEITVAQGSSSGESVPAQGPQRR